MDWRYRPGESPISASTDLPSGETASAFESLITNTRLSLSDFNRDRSTSLWRRLDEEIAAGRLPKEEVERLRRDHDGGFSIPLVRCYLEAGQEAAVTKWMRQSSSFWSYNWLDRSVFGARGRGTIQIFRVLQNSNGAVEGAALAADHLWHRLVGARYHAGLRQESREWYKHHDRDTRRQAVLDHRVRYGTPHRFEVVLEWLEYIGLTLKPFISVGNEDAIARLDRVNEEVATERARFHSDIDF